MANIAFLLKTNVVYVCSINCSQLTLSGNASIRCKGRLSVVSEKAMPTYTTNAKKKQKTKCHSLWLARLFVYFSGVCRGSDATALLVYIPKHIKMIPITPNIFSLKNYENTLSSLICRICTPPNFYLSKVHIIIC